MIGAAIAESLSTVPVSGFVFDPWATLGPKTPSGEVINESTALTCAAVKAAVTVLAETVATLPLNVYKRLPDGDQRPAPEHPVQRLLHDEPNPETSSFIWREALQGHLGTWGNAYAEIQRVGNQTPVALWQRSPQPQRTEPERRKTDGQLVYSCRSETGEKTEIEARQMLHIPGFGFDGLVGYSPVALMRDPIGVNKAAERYAGELFKNDARQTGYLSIPSELSKDAYERMKTSINESGSEHGNRHKLGILEDGATFAAAQMNPEDVQMIEARRFGIEEIARAYRIAPPILQDLTHGTYSNVSELGRQFIVYTMMPWLARWKAEINRKLLGDGYFCEFNVHAFMQGDHAARATYYYKGLTTGQFSINEIRALENQNSIGPDGDARFIPANVIPLKRALQEPPKPVPVPTPPADKKPDNDDDPSLARLAVWNAASELHVKEGKAAIRQANKYRSRTIKGGNFIGWLDAFFDDAHQELCEKKFELAARLSNLPASVLAVAHMGESKRTLLAAAECKPDQLSERVARCVAQWAEKRTIDTQTPKEIIHG